MSSNGPLLSFFAANSGRRRFLSTASKALSATAVAMLAGCESLASDQKNSGMSPGDDVAILNAALAAEREAIAAYQLGAESGLLESGVLSLAVTFQGHHKAHADLLAATVLKLGGTTVDEKDHYDFPVSELNNQSDVLRFAAKLESGAVSAYLDAVPNFDNRDLSRAAASILGDEAMHWAILRQALGEEPVPAAFVG